MVSRFKEPVATIPHDFSHKGFQHEYKYHCFSFLSSKHTASSFCLFKLKSNLVIKFQNTNFRTEEMNKKITFSFDSLGFCISNHSSVGSISPFYRIQTSTIETYLGEYNFRIIALSRAFSPPPLSSSTSRMVRWQNTNIELILTEKYSNK